MATQACRGRGSASRMALLLCLGCALWCWTASAATYTVGDTSGWTTGYNYSAWAASQTFAKGDVLFFPYATLAHDVAVVSKAGYDACTNPTNGVVYTAGNTSVTLNVTPSYYICTIPTHCSSGGMKLAITYSASTPSSPPNSTSNSSSPGSPKSAAVPSITSTQLGYFAAIFSTLLAGFIL